MQCGLCPSRNQVAMIAIFLCDRFVRCFRNISVVIATSCRFLCGNITKVKTPIRDDSRPLERFISPSLDKSQSAPLFGLGRAGEQVYRERVTLELACVGCRQSAEQRNIIEMPHGPSDLSQIIEHYAPNGIPHAVKIAPTICMTYVIAVSASVPYHCFTDFFEHVIKTAAAERIDDRKSSSSAPGKRST